MNNCGTLLVEGFSGVCSFLRCASESFSNDCNVCKNFDKGLEIEFCCNGHRKAPLCCGGAKAFSGDGDIKL